MKLHQRVRRMREEGRSAAEIAQTIRSGKRKRMFFTAGAAGLIALAALGVWGFSKKGKELEEPPKKPEIERVEKPQRKVPEVNEGIKLEKRKIYSGLDDNKRVWVFTLGDTHDRIREARIEKNRLVVTAWKMESEKREWTELAKDIVVTEIALDITTGAKRKERRLHSSKRKAATKDNKHSFRDENGDHFQVEVVGDTVFVYKNEKPFGRIRCQTAEFTRQISFIINGGSVLWTYDITGLTAYDYPNNVDWKKFYKDKLMITHQGGIIFVDLKTGFESLHFDMLQGHKRPGFDAPWCFIGEDKNRHYLHNGSVVVAFEK